MRILALAFALVLPLAFGSDAGASENRVALVIGNSSYQHAPRLATPVNDAEDIAKALGGLGFDVVLRRDTAASDLRQTLQDFAERSTKADFAIIYFAGYSLNAGVDGYLIPVDARLATPDAFRTETITLRAAMLQVAGARVLGLVILDALRGNPFPAKLGRQDSGRDFDVPSSGGLDASRNALVFFATEPSRTSEEGQGRNSPLAAALLKYLPEPDLEISFLFRNVRDEVRNSTRQKQTPYMYGQLSRGKIYLNAVKQAAFSPVQADPSAALPCDNLAAAPDDSKRGLGVKGVKLEDIKPALAIAACSQAVRELPGVDRFHYQLGRALYAVQDYPAALASYKKAFELGNTRALYALGSMYDNGEGVERDPARARFYYEIAAEMKFAPAIVSLGLQQERGLGGDRNPAKAYALYQRAADLGDAKAINKLGELTEKGLGVEANVKQARALYEKSAAMGDPDAMVNLARCSANGIGGKKDIPEARRLLQKAAQAGSKEAKAILASVGSPRDTPKNAPKNPPKDSGRK
ncbi:SEL1-like repeat protein [Bradyrhizobium lablabi]|uniref:caspase family protein n=1 Tax=Bradyrhizobium lablabi TaxID=722472 RepID=UPI001BA867B3|nr:caspase family protein [Bradyrhizobium lablabi]MBR1120850.1 SEL1-like repeat protein [Bradyrhizobium lablabi]